MNRSDPGYAIFEHVFSRTEMTRALADLESAPLERTRAGARHIITTPAVRALSSAPRLMIIAAQFVGGGAVPFRATLFDKSPQANWLVAWHQDTALPLTQRVEHPELGPWSLKAGVLPDTHRRGVLADDEIERLARKTAAIDCVGGVRRRGADARADDPCIIEVRRRSATARAAHRVRRIGASQSRTRTGRCLTCTCDILAQAEDHGRLSGIRSGFRGRLMLAGFRRRACSGALSGSVAFCVFNNQECLKCE
jgi:hypothetical protein